MLRLALLVGVLAGGPAGQERDRGPAPARRPAAWASDARRRLAEAQAALEDARKQHRARLEETRTEGARRTPR